MTPSGMVLTLLCAAFVGALFGLAGGYGGAALQHWIFRARLAGLELLVDTLDRRLKSREGQAGHEKKKANETRADQELADLERAAAEQRGRGPVRAPGAPGPGPDFIALPPRPGRSA